ncbi:thymidine kinase [Candidatus Odyssella acanthamoebae]|uniref:Thymidine kinase n=1 Tax=Candidatus Odyssella acanthamoebae TaxID=91604 RepID=A0A077AUW6_9PROT|nr:thymidine kinase [Candidatus Paracaedibacter acanthamoebae]AIK95829.1 thymidine kinase [Candidatus Paracaedibacter acanthamoebae]
MAKLYFYYSAMNAGKTTTLLQSSYNYRERGMNTLLFTADLDDRFGRGKIASRIGLSSEAHLYDEAFNFFDFIKAKVQITPNLKCILVDEAQFLSKDHVRQLCDVVDNLKLPVLTYGIRSDFQGELFPGSYYLLAWADELIELKTICHCGRKATMNARMNAQGEFITQGEQIEIAGNDRYIALCREHFHTGQVQPESHCVIDMKVA